MSRKKENNRTVIDSSKNRRPYGAKLTLLIEDDREFKIDAECSLLVSPNIIIRIKPANDATYLTKRCWDVYVEGFATAGEAEKCGLKVALGLLWGAFQNKFSARLLYHTPLPCVVYDRTASKGLTFSGHCTCLLSYAVKNIVKPLDEIVSSKNDLDQRLLVAIEIFTGAKMQTTERSKFVNLVSAIEPLAFQQKYENSELHSLISDFKSKLDLSDIEPSIKVSLKGRIEQLKVESVSKAIRRIIKEKLPNDKYSLEVIEEAYGLRSKILHEGSTDADLQQKSNEVENVIRLLIEKSVKDTLDL
ncbi:MAG: hypothetical protein HQK65_12380 [Desulfamplus sp.]|nr:hypothetical protein [Desulfamplus sp.]